MDISVALDGSRKRNLEFIEGDDSVLNVTVYAHDGDTEPLMLSGLSIEYGSHFPYGSSIDIGTGFNAQFCSRTPYSLIGTVNGNRMTLAYGLITSPKQVYCYCGFQDYGYYLDNTGQNDGQNLNIVRGLSFDGYLIQVDGPGYSGVLEFS